MKLFAALLAVAALALGINAHADTPKIGVVVMHGKGGSPAKHVSHLAEALERDGYLVANLEMPWSGNRSYDVDVSAAENEVEAALARLRERGAARVFVAGHSQGGLFALHFGGRHRVDGVVAIAPGGNVASPIFREKLGEAVELARTMVAEGKAQDKTRFSDFESSKGTFPVITTPASYLSWFGPEGAMNQKRAMQAIPPDTPVLFIAPTRDYPGLVRIRQEMFGLLAPHPLTKMAEPDSSHIDAPRASAKIIGDWMTQVAGQ